MFKISQAQIIIIIIKLNYSKSWNFKTLLIKTLRKELKNQMFREDICSIYVISIICSIYNVNTVHEGCY